MGQDPPPALPEPGGSGPDPLAVLSRVALPSPEKKQFRGCLFLALQNTEKNRVGSADFDAPHPVRAYVDSVQVQFRICVLS